MTKNHCIIVVSEDDLKKDQTKERFPSLETEIKYPEPIDGVSSDKLYSAGIADHWLISNVVGQLAKDILLAIDNAKKLPDVKEVMLASVDIGGRTAYDDLCGEIDMLLLSKVINPDGYYSKAALRIVTRKSTKAQPFRIVEPLHYLHGLGNGHPIKDLSGKVVICIDDIIDDANTRSAIDMYMYNGLSVP
ncbi:hypothetical protein JXC34_03835, partial [Candidatus Woesearchaeota archaeon]|nr:hypothetical protein [Candidatus Woesearchaeota archaeon]